MIDTRLSSHAGLQAQRRGVAQRTLDLILRHSDRSAKLPGNKTRALWISRKGRQRLVWRGFTPAEVARASGVRLVVNIDEDLVVTVEHATARRAWA